MFNLRFVFSPGSCGYYCLRYILKQKIKKITFMSLYDVKRELNSYGRYCTGLKIDSLYNIKRECLTLIKTSKKSYHYVVIKEVRSKCVVYYDPLFINLRRKKVTKFDKKWSGVCLFYTKV